MKVISVISQKGGVGKTTIATALAVEAERNKKRCVVYDVDPQGTACFWKDTREEESPAVVSVQPIRLKAMIEAAQETGTDIVFIDAPPVARDAAYEICKVADLVLIPTKAAVFDTVSMMQTLEIVNQVGKSCEIVLNFVPPQGREISDALAAAEELGAKICPVYLGNRKDHYKAQAVGLAAQEFNPKDKAAKEIVELYSYIAKRVYTNKEGVDHGELAASGA